MDSALAIARTLKWFERFVVGNNFCPFAGVPHRNNRIRFVCSEARDPEALMLDLWQEATHLLDESPEKVETTLLIHPWVLSDFSTYLDFLEAVDLLWEERDWEGELQIASFHPDFCFDGVAPDDITNYTNRSPYPILHLLREDSVSIAVEEHPNVDAIPDRNIAWLEAQNPEEILRMWEECKTFRPDKSLE